MIGIYKIENLINGKVYIGQSTDIKERWASHKRIIFENNKESNIKKNYPLYLAFKNMGLKIFLSKFLKNAKVLF